MLGSEEVGFVLTGMSWTRGSRFCIDWNVLDRRKSVLYRLEWLGMEEVGFVSTGMSWTGGSWFCIDWNGLEWRKLVLYRLECLGPEEVGFVSARMSWTGGSPFCIDWNGRLLEVSLASTRTILNERSRLYCWTKAKNL